MVKVSVKGRARYCMPCICIILLEAMVIAILLLNDDNVLNLDHDQPYGINTNNITATPHKQIAFNKFADYLSSIAAKTSQKSPTYFARNMTIDDMHFYRISKELIINTLSNKTIVFFGDSLGYFLLSYILNTIFWCCDYKAVVPRSQYSRLEALSLNRATAGSYCSHLMQNESLILNKFSKNVMTNRNHLRRILSKFDMHDFVGTFDHNWSSSVHLNHYNITFHLYYKRGSDIEDADRMIFDYKKYVNETPFDIMINNMANMHWPHALPQYENNPLLSIQFIKHAEHYMEEMVAHKKKEQCLIFGPTNPVMAIPPYSDTNQFSSIQRKLLLGSYTNLTYPKVNEYQLLFSLLDNYLDANISTALLSNAEEEVLYKCSAYFLSNGYLNDTNEANTVCVLYYWGFGNNIIHHRMKQFVGDYNVNNKVYYDDRYNIYSNFSMLYNYVDGRVHYPQLLPIAWTQLLNIIANGC